MPNLIYIFGYEIMVRKRTHFTVIGINRKCNCSDAAGNEIGICLVKRT